MQTTLRKYLSGAMVCFMLTLSVSLLAQDNPPPQDNGAPPPTDAPQANAPVTLQNFYDQLAPYGQWVNYPNYGYVFIPSVAPGFTPYSTNGHWVYNDAYGWTWASDYAWGWAAFHYGRWNYDASYGWFWIPDLNWGPGWVAWRNCQGYYGWAPLPYGVNINVGFGGGYNIAAEHWCFVPQAHLCELNLGAFFIPREHNYAFIQHSTIIDRMDYDNGRRFGYFKGPDRVEVEGYTHRPVEIVSVDRYRYAPARTVVVEHRGAPERVVEQRHDAPVVRQDNHVVAERTNHAPTHFVEARNVPQRGRH